jgi:hypothetical protein
MTRRRWVYFHNAATGQVESIEVSEDYAPADVRAPVFTDRYMEGVQATDGTDISSRGKRTEWMKRNNLVDVDDCKGMWAKAAKERQSVAEGRHDTAARREAVGRAVYELNRRR